MNPLCMPNNTIQYGYKPDGGALPPPMAQQLQVFDPHLFALIQMPGPGAVALYHENPWYLGPYSTNYQIPGRQTPYIYTGAPPIDGHMYDLPLTTGYNPGNPGGC